MLQTAEFQWRFTDPQNCLAGMSNEDLEYTSTLEVTSARSLWLLKPDSCTECELLASPCPGTLVWASVELPLMWNLCVYPVQAEWCWTDHGPSVFPGSLSVSGPSYCWVHCLWGRTESQMHPPFIDLWVLANTSEESETVQGYLEKLTKSKTLMCWSVSRTGQLSFRITF